MLCHVQVCMKPLMSYPGGAGVRGSWQGKMAGEVPFSLDGAAAVLLSSYSYRQGAPLPRMQPTAPFRATGGSAWRPYGVLGRYGAHAGHGVAHMGGYGAGGRDDVETESLARTLGLGGWQVRHQALLLTERSGSAGFLQVRGWRDGGVDGNKG